MLHLTNTKLIAIICCLTLIFDSCKFGCEHCNEHWGSVEDRFGFF